MWLFHGWLWASDSFNNMDLYPSYTERAGESDLALKVQRESPGKSRLKGTFQLERAALKLSVIGGGTILLANKHIVIKQEKKLGREKLLL